jgi:hypothetical protein
MLRNLQSEKLLISDSDLFRSEAKIYKRIWMLHANNFVIRSGSRVGTGVRSQYRIRVGGKRFRDR